MKKEKTMAENVDNDRLSCEFFEYPRIDIVILAMIIPISAIKRAKIHQVLIILGKLKANIEAETTIEKKVVVNWAKDCGFFC